MQTLNVRQCAIFFVNHINGINTGARKSHHQDNAESRHFIVWNSIKLIFVAHFPFHSICFSKQVWNIPLNSMRNACWQWKRSRWIFTTNFGSGKMYISILLPVAFGRCNLLAVADMVLFFCSYPLDFVYGMPLGLRSIDSMKSIDFYCCRKNWNSKCGRRWSGWQARSIGRNNFVISVFSLFSINKFQKARIRLFTFLWALTVTDLMNEFPSTNWNRIHSNNF